ncbi:MAG: hypothetical protein ABFR89_04555 [Actinomycetota bacterium]
MPDHIDESLLASPLGEERRSPRGLLIGWVMIALVVLIVAVVWLSSGDNTEEAPGGGESTGSERFVGTMVAAETTDTTAALEVVLWPYESDPPILYHPTALPKGWETCRVVEDASKGDRFCDPQDPDRWVQVRVRQARDARYDGLPPVGDDDNGVWVERGATNEVAYRRSGNWIVVRNDDTLPAETLVEIATSIPVVGDFNALYGSYEVPLALEEVTDDDLADLMADFGSEPRVVRGDAEANVYAADASICGFHADGYSVPDFAWMVPQPRLVVASVDQPIVIGYSADKNRAYAVWDQAGYGWRLEGRMTVEEIEAAALALLERIGELPTISS